MSSVTSIFSALSDAALATIIVVAVVLKLFFILSAWNDRLDYNEPVLARPKVPFIGHAIGFFWHENHYFSIIRERFQWPICTLKIFSTKIYIIYSPELAQAVFRNSKTIDFDSVMSPAACKVMQFNKHATDIVCFQPKDKSESSYVLDLHHETFGALAKGPSLLNMSIRVLDHHSKTLNMITSQPKSLLRWLGDLYTMASANALYGADNPIAKDPSLIQHMWNFEDDIGLLAVGFMPSIIARKGYEARRIMTQAFFTYYNAGLDKNATGLVQGRIRAARKWGLTTEDICKTEIAILTASVTNTVPDIFYMICYVFSNPDLLSRLRKEISVIVTQGRGLDSLALDHTKVETHCPLLVSCYHETLRLNKTGSLLRAVLSDTMLNNQYLLKKGSFIQIATGHIHLDPNNWGPDSRDFNPERFLARESRERNKTQGQAFLPFGGGRNLCPGRHLAFTEITSFVAMFVYGFDISLSDGSVLKIPERRFHKMAVASRSPKEDINVVIRRRKKFETVVWEFTTSS